MSYPIEDILSILVDNIVKYGSPFRIDHRRLNRWAYENNLKTGGDTVLYTGLLYQLTPYIEASTRYLAKMGRKMGTIARLASKLIDLTKLLRVDEKTVNYVNQVLDNIAKMVKNTYQDIGYLYDKEPYSGVLLYDLGMIRLFENHANRVMDIFRENGVKKVVTIDPHTTHIIRDIYPKYVDGYDLEVINYLNLINLDDLEPGLESGEEYVIHDPCIYARIVGIIDKPRELLEKGGAKILEPEYSRQMTYCCGGPIESIYPELSSEIAKKRLRQLASKSSKIVTLCPICYINLSRAALDEGMGEVEIRDLASILR